MNAPRPLLVYDGTCGFCRRWIERWKLITGERVEYAAYQDVAASHPEIPLARFAAAVQLILPDGTHCEGAEAVFRSLAVVRSHRAWIWMYSRVPGFAPVSEALYRAVAAHRPLLSRVTGWLWGPHVAPPGMRFTSWLFLRLLGLVFVGSFLSLGSQILGLVGHDGILPAHDYLEAVRSQLGPRAVWFAPTLCWFSTSDAFLRALCTCGAVCGALLAIGVAPVATLLGAWVCALSVTVVGQDFLWFQWDGLLLEAGFLALLIAPWRRFSRPDRDPAPSAAGIWILRWLLFRLMFSSAVVKWTSGDPTWRTLTALNFHYQTQPLPPWTAWYAHHLPAAFQKFSAAVMFAIEGAVPFLIFAPRRPRIGAALAITMLQTLIALTGNYGFFNLLSITLCVLLLDDAAWPWRWRPTRGLTPALSEPAPVRALARAELEPNSDAEADATTARTHRVRDAITAILAFALFAISLVSLARALTLPDRWLGPLPAVESQISTFRIVDPYGLFAVMTTTRNEIVVEGSDDGETWQPYEFRYKPGNLTRRPAFMTPAMPRLDWQMWFAALSSYRREPWFLRFCERLLKGSPSVRNLLAPGAYESKPPRFVRAVVYEYRFTTAAERGATGAWWSREVRGLYCPVLTLDHGYLAAVRIP
jgi:lipase maturation factor 1